MRQAFGEFLPDQPDHANPGLTQADGVMRIANGYAPVPSFVPLPNGTLPSLAMGAGGYRVAAETFLFAGTATNIYRYQSAGYASLKSGLSTSTAVGIRFAPYNMLMLATNGIDPIQKFDPASPASFAVLSTDAPTARFMAVVRGFVVVGYADDDSLRIGWSDDGDPTGWVPGTLEAGFYIMPSGGDITGVVGGDYALILQENRVIRMGYTGDDTIWQFEEIATDVGCIAPRSVATYGRLTYFLSNKGFMVCDGNTVSPIGLEKIDRTYLAQLDRLYLESMSAVVDPRNSLYLVTVPNANPANSVYIDAYALDNSWSTAPITTELMFSALALGTTLEDLDAIYPNLDTMPISLDSASLRGGYPLLLLFDGLHRLGALTGSPVQAQIAGAQGELYPGQRARVRSARLISDTPVATITVSGANSFAAIPANTDYAIRTSAGVYRMRENWNLLQTTMTIPAATQWTYAQGLDLEAVPGGRA